MDDELVARWNAVVSPEDTVYHLGDFTLSDERAARSYFARLNGTIRVLKYPWHHDYRWVPDTFGPSETMFSASGHPVILEPPMVVLELPDYGDPRYGQALVLCHYALSVWDRRHHGAWHLYGHSHGTHRNGGKSFDVGVDCHDFAPVSLEDVAARMDKLPLETPDYRAD